MSQIWTQSVKKICDITNGTTTHNETIGYAKAKIARPAIYMYIDVRIQYNIRHSLTLVQI